LQNQKKDEPAEIRKKENQEAEKKRIRRQKLKNRKY
jgi:hypothetical protein